MPYKDRDVQRAYQRNYMRRRRETWFAGKSCVRCGSVESLELDHVDPATKIAHAVWSWSAVRRDEELAKCQVLCKACHAVKTAAENAVEEIPHGTHSGYSKHRCKCDDCRAAHALYQREWAAKRRAA